MPLRVATDTAETSPAHADVEAAIVVATERDTRLIMRSLRNTERVPNNANVEKVPHIERERGNALRFRGYRLRNGGRVPQGHAAG